MPENKGQSAIEYLTTYGWMLLVIAIVGGAIFTTVQNSSQIQSVSGLSNADVQVSDYGLNSDGLQLSLRAATSDQVDIQKIEITDTETGISADINPSEVVAVGDTAQVNLQDVQTTETSGTYDMDITYNTGGLEGLTAEGRITGSFGVFNRISLEEAKFNRSTDELKIDVKNTGDNTTDSISYMVEANNTDYTGSLPNLDAGEKTQINISTDETYPLKSVNLETEGTHFVDSDSGLKCTPTKGLVGYWPFNGEQTQNGYAIDLSGQGNNGSLENGVTTGVNGPIGEAYSFDGNDDRIQFGNTDGLNFTKEFTLMGEINPELDSKYRFLYFHETWDRITTRIENNNNLMIELEYQDGTESGEFEPFNIQESNWLHYTQKWSSSSGSLSTFIDGSRKGSITTGQGKLLASSNSANPYIGGTGDNAYKGKFDEVRIYNRSLSQQEIQRLYSVRSEDWAVSGCKLTG